MTGLIRIYLPSSLGSNSLQSAVDLLIQPVEPSAGSKMPAFTFRPVPKSSIPSMDAPHVLMDYVSLRKLVTMRKEMLLSDRPHNGECERRSAATELATQTADDLHSPALPPELDLGLDADGQELVWMMEFASSESGDSAVMSGCGCGDSTHAGDAQVEDDELVPKIVEVVEEDPLHELAPTLSHRGATVFESLTDLDAFPPLPDSPASSIFGDDFDIHSSLPDSVPASGAVNSEPTSSTQLNLQRPSIERAPCTSNATLASSPILKETDLTPVASPTIDAVEHGEHPESPMSPSNKALALDTPTAEPAQVLASRAVSAVQEGHGSVESQLPETASAVEAAPMLPRTVSEPISPAPSKSVVRPPPVSRVASDSAMSVSMASPADGGGASTPLRESVDLGSSTMRTSKSSKSSLIKRFSQSFLTLTRTGKHDKQREDLAVPPTPAQTTLGSSLSLSHSVDLAPLSPVAPAIVQPAAGAEESSKLLKKKSKLFSSLFGGKGQGHDEDKAAKKERKAQEKAEKAARKEAKRFAKALTS